MKVWFAWSFISALSVLDSAQGWVEFVREEKHLDSECLETDESAGFLAEVILEVCFPNTNGGSIIHYADTTQSAETIKIHSVSYAGAGCLGEVLNQDEDELSTTCNNGTSMTTAGFERAEYGSVGAAVLIKFKEDLPDNACDSFNATNPSWMLDSRLEGFNLVTLGKAPNCLGGVAVGNDGQLSMYPELDCSGTPEVTTCRQDKPSILTVGMTLESLIAAQKVWEADAKAKDKIKFSTARVYNDEECKEGRPQDLLIDDFFGLCRLTGTSSSEKLVYLRFGERGLEYQRQKFTRVDCSGPLKSYFPDVKSTLCNSGAKIEPTLDVLEDPTGMLVLLGGSLSKPSLRRTFCENEFQKASLPELQARGVLSEIDVTEFVLFQNSQVCYQGGGFSMSMSEESGTTLYKAPGCNKKDGILQGESGKCVIAPKKPVLLRGYEVYFTVPLIQYLNLVDPINFQLDSPLVQDVTTTTGAPQASPVPSTTSTLSASFFIAMLTLQAFLQ